MSSRPLPRIASNVEDEVERVELGVRRPERAEDPRESSVQLYGVDTTQDVSLEARRSSGRSDFRSVSTTRLFLYRL